jgi:hypothetical protein
MDCRLPIANLFAQVALVLRAILHLRSSILFDCGSAALIRFVVALSAQCLACLPVSRSPADKNAGVPPKV